MSVKGNVLLPLDKILQSAAKISLIKTDVVYHARTRITLFETSTMRPVEFGPRTLTAPNLRTVNKIDAVV